MFFDYTVGPHSWKRFLYPPVKKLWNLTRGEAGWTIAESDEKAPKRALIGVRSCELHAMAIQDKIMIDGPFADPAYRDHRNNLFIIAVNCTRAGGTCFCELI
jgi:sulfhydrogenase subunit beta (sulfur reductase)